MIHRSELCWILGLMFLDVCLVNPTKGLHEHVVHGRTQITHEAHQEERNLQDGVLDELDAVDDIFGP
jgi:hypothetical protein